MKWNDPAIYFASELASSERHSWELQREHHGEFALYRGEELIGVFKDTISALDEGHRRFGSNFMVQAIGETSEEVLLGVLPAFADEDSGD
jgi:hypothetical protein